MNTQITDRPRAGWRQVPRDLAYLLPGLPIAIASFTIMVTGFFLGLGLFVLAFLGLIVWIAMFGAARGFAVAERARVALMEDRPVGPAYHRPASGKGLARLFSFLRDPLAWREWGFGILILPIRCFTWSMTIAWTAAALGGTTYALWEWSLPRDNEESDTLAELIGLGDGRLADVALNTAIGLVFLATLPYLLRAFALTESSLVWAMLTNENAALRARADELSRSRTAVVQAEADTLRRVERDIHDGPQQRLVRLTMDLESAQRRFDDDPEAARPLLEGAVTQTKEALAELRAVSRGIAPPILTDRGLPAALAAATARCPVPTTLDVGPDLAERLPSAIENAAYFVVTESLTNVAKHSQAARCAVSVVRVDDVLHVQIADDGRGGAHLGKGHGLAGLADRLAGVDGRLDIVSPPAGGTTVSAELPIPAASTAR
ncbi:sensor domain-containing protein [Jiangella sp. DSM 45060]|uniref:sensor histidine kinase n=1 Tax=Jiangella sp. DSM 45060 TaxID=1798224 RepID=UPI00087BBA31|nr:sensor domain-containing protein [Jiangella sp. DSM 45060]SDS36499.1 Signal transduction histidine kinase [Jiangella sp. DSM 45060]